MSKTHWKALADTSQYLGKQHFGPDEKKDVTIESVEEQTVENHAKRTKDVKAIMFFVEKDVRPWIVNKTNRSKIAELLESPYIEDWAGKRITLFVDPKVPNNFDPSNPGAVRVWPVLPKEDHIVCENCGVVIEPHGDYSVNKIVTRSRARWNKSLCWDCSIAKLNTEKEAEA